MDPWEGCVWIKCCGFFPISNIPTRQNLYQGCYFASCFCLFLFLERMKRRKTSVSFQSLVSQQRSPAQGLGAPLPFWVFVLGTHLRLCWVVLSHITWITAVTITYNQPEPGLNEHFHFSYCT